MVFYRKYRPQKISELDLSSVRDRLISILLAKEIPHAFLFTGPKGLGKTSSARILAKAINCENRGKDYEPCNKCDACISITNGSNLDVIEIDAASNRGIDEIRDLREKIKFSPSSLKKKVYIIDEVHMLTTDAFNALLKTLEEPPSHAIFILCTTETEKVPATIISRTFHVTFQKPTEEELSRSLSRIVTGEKLDVDASVLPNIFRLSEGSFRDASKILEDLSFAASGKTITPEILEANYKTESISGELVKLLDGLAVHDLKACLAIIETFVQKGADFKIIMERLAQMLHDVLMLRAKVSSVGKDVPGLTNKDLEGLLSSLNDNYKNLKFSVLPQIPLELVVIGWCLDGTTDNGQLTTDKKNNEDVVQNQESRIKNQGESREEVKKEPKLEEKSPKTEEAKKTEEVRIPETVAKKEEPAEEVAEEAEKDHGDLFKRDSKPENFFATLLVLIKRDNHSIAGILRGCRLVEITPGKVVFETKYKFHKDKLSESKIRLLLEERSSEILKDAVKVDINLSGK